MDVTVVGICSAAGGLSQSVASKATLAPDFVSLDLERGDSFIMRAPNEMLISNEKRTAEQCAYA